MTLVEHYRIARQQCAIMIDLINAGEWEAFFETSMDHQKKIEDLHDKVKSATMLAPDHLVEIEALVDECMKTHKVINGLLASESTTVKGQIQSEKNRKNLNQAYMNF